MVMNSKLGCRRR